MILDLATSLGCVRSKKYYHVLYFTLDRSSSSCRRVVSSTILAKIYQLTNSVSWCFEFPSHTKDQALSLLLPATPHARISMAAVATACTAVSGGHGSTSDGSSFQVDAAVPFQDFCGCVLWRFIWHGPPLMYLYIQVLHISYYKRGF